MRQRDDADLLGGGAALLVHRPDQEGPRLRLPEQRLAAARGAHQFIVDEPINHAAVSVGDRGERNLCPPRRRRRIR